MLDDLIDPTKLDEPVNPDTIENFASQIGQVPKELIMKFDEHYGLNQDIEFYHGMLKEAVNMFALLDTIKPKISDGDLESPSREHILTIKRAGQRLLYDIAYLSFKIKEMDVVH